MSLRIESQRELIPGYRLLEPLGRGGYGEVWKAEAPGGVLKAVKLVYGDLQSINPDGARAAQELKALARVKTVRHPYILSLDRYDIVDGQLIIVMELADENLEHRLQHWQKQGAPGIPRAELLRYLEEAAEALDLMNTRHDLQHLDIKPQNLFLVESHVKVADFGLVKDLKGLAASVTGGVTPQYAAPEMFQGWVSRYTDQYSLAIVYQELLTGQRPFRGQHIQQLVLQHIQGQPQLEPLPEADRPIIARSLSKDPNGRFPSCLEMVRALQKAGMPAAEVGPGDGPAQVRSNGAPERSPPAGVSVSTPSESPATFAPSARNRSEECGDGILFPALVIGLGRMGASILQHLRREVRQRFGDLNAVPHLSFLYMDTDPAAVERVRADASKDPLTPDEVLLCRLQRVGHYLRQRDTMPPIQDWLNPAMLYRLSRDGTTNGIRALGRLALLSNYRSVVNRLLRELSRIMDRVSLAAAAKSTGLGLRSNWPRVYVATSLWGGSGSGMFLDLAYIVRAVLRELSVGRQEIIGLLALPPPHLEADDSDLRAANTYAALREVSHFQTPGERFRARYEAKSPAVEEALPPFARCTLFGAPGPVGHNYFAELATAAAGGLQWELLTPLSQAIQEAEPAGAGRSLSCSGWQVLASPRRLVIHAAAQRLVDALVKQWARTDVPPDQAEPLRDQVEKHFADAGLDLGALAQQVREQSAETLPEPYEATFARWLEPLQVEPPTWPEPAAFQAVLQQVEEYFGALQDGLSSLGPAPAAAAVRDAAAALAERARHVVSDFITGFIDRPGDRLAAAEEAARVSAALVDQSLRKCEELVRQLESRLTQLAATIRSSLAQWDRSKSAPPGKRGESAREGIFRDLAQQLAAYPDLLLRTLIHQRLAGLYLGLRGYLSDQMRELGYIRQPLAALKKQLKTAVLGDGEAASAGRVESRCRPLLSPDCARIDQRVSQVIQSLGADALVRLDHVIETAARKEWGGLAEVFRSPGHRLLGELQTILVREAETFLDVRLPREDAAECFFARGLDESAVRDDIQLAFDEAVPSLAEQRLGHQREVNVLVTPRSEAGQRFRGTAIQAIPGIQAVESSDDEEILFYREYQGLDMTDLPHAGPSGRAAYDRALRLEQFTPHSRTDISEWRELS